jgi:hypothetical protein
VKGGPVKSEIVYLDGVHHRRATVPTAQHARPRERGAERIPDAAILIPAHVIEAHDQTYISFSTMKTGKRRVPKQHIPDAVKIGSCRHYFERGSCKKVRVIPQEYIERLGSIDDEITRLEKERRDLIEDAYVRGRHLWLGDIAEGTALYRAECARLEEERKAKVANEQD